MKRAFTYLLVFISMISIAQIPTAGLISGWPFTNGSTNDFSPNNNNLTAFNGPAPCPDRFGNANCAYLFDGINDYMLAVKPGPLKKKSRSVNFWAKTTTSFNSSGYTVLNYGNYTGGGSRFECGLNSGCNGLYVDYGNGYITKTFTNTINNQWHMFTVVYDSTISNQITSVLYYVDASPVSASCMTFNTIQTVNTTTLDPINIGRLTASIPRYFNGAIDDIYVYDRPLSPAEITTIYNTLPCTAAPSNPGAISGVNTICQGASTMYSVAPVSGASSYTWTFPGGWTGTSSTNTIMVTAGANSGVISVVAGNTCGNSQPSMTNIVANPPPTLSVTADKMVLCNGNSTSIYAGGASTYTWNSTIITPSITVSPTTSTSYSVSGSNSFGCISSSIITITVTNNPLPTITVSGPTLSCAGQNINLASNGASTYTWQPGGMNGFFVSVSPTITTVYTVTGTDANGCYNSATYTQSVSACTGIAAINNSGITINIHPNPFKDQLTVSFEKNSGSVIEIYNLTGSLIYKKDFNSNSINIDFTGKESGIYFVRIINPAGTYSRKIIKE